MLAKLRKTYTSLIQLGAYYLVIIYTFLVSIQIPLVVIISLRYFTSILGRRDLLAVTGVALA